MESTNYTSQNEAEAWTWVDSGGWVSGDIEPSPSRYMVDDVIMVHEIHLYILHHNDTFAQLKILSPHTWKDPMAFPHPAPTLPPDGCKQ